MKFKKDLQEALLNTKEAVGAFKAVCNISDDKKEIFRYYMRYQKEHNKLLKIYEKITGFGNVN